MATTYKLDKAEHRLTSAERRLGPVWRRAIIVALTLATAAIHLTLGGVLFTLNAIGYVALAGAFVLPGPVARVRWLARLALLGFTLATIAGWLLFGARFPLAYLDKGLGFVLVVALAVDLWVSDGGPREIVRRVRRLWATIARNLPVRV